MCVNLGREALPVGAAVLVSAEFREEHDIEARALRAVAAASRFGNKDLVRLAERRGGQFEQDIGLNPCRQFADRD